MQIDNTPGKACCMQRKSFLYKTLRTRSRSIEGTPHGAILQRRKTLPVNSVILSACNQSSYGIVWADRWFWYWPCITAPTLRDKALYSGDTRMSSASAQSAETKNEEIPADLLELTAAIQALPIEQRVALLPALRRVTDSSVRRRRILTLVQEALGQLRLDMKYLVFDLEATRRERDGYLQKLTDIGQGDND